MKKKKKKKVLIKHCLLFTPHLQHDGINAGELGLLPVQILYGALQQQDLWVLDVSVHLYTVKKR